MKYCLILFVLFGCNESSLSNAACDQPCYTGPEWAKGIGACKLGKIACDVNGINLGCVGGSVLPSRELCNKIDDNCDGEVDDYLQGMSPFFVPEAHCSDVGVCWRATSTSCINGEWVCNYPANAEMPDETSCDGLDNDCDGIIDDIDFLCTDLLGNPASCSCYEGPVGTERNGQCDNGFYICTDAQIICEGQVLPSEEICDGIDNDCNRIVDDLEDNTANYDIIFNIDYSGSMLYWIDAVRGGLLQFLDTHPGPRFRYALILISLPYPDYYHLSMNFTDSQTMHDRLLTIRANGGGFEPTINLLYDVCDPMSAFLDQSGYLRTQLNWREISTLQESSIKLSLLFTDEQAQTRTDRIITYQDAIDMCWNNNVINYIWGRGTAGFLQMAQDTGGTYFGLTGDASLIFNDLNQIELFGCVPP